MGLETDSCKFDSAISLLREFVTRCSCIKGVSSGVDEAVTAIEVLQEIYNIHSSTIRQLQSSLKSFTSENGLSGGDVLVKKEISEEFDIDDAKTHDKENGNYFEEFHYEDENSFDASGRPHKQEGGVLGRVKKKNKRKDREKIKKVKKIKKTKTKKIKLFKSKSKTTINTLNSIIVKTEKAEIKTEKSVLIPEGLVYSAAKRKKRKDGLTKRKDGLTKRKDGLTKSAKAKLETLEKRQEREDHYQLFGKKYVCALCNKNFAIKVFLEKHMMKEHGPQKKEVQWECDECGRFYASKRQLERHKMIHRGEKSFQCEICGRGFDTYDTRYIHQFVHTDNKYMCDYCGKVYRQRRHLVQHMKNHNGYIWKCKDCGKVFDTQRKWLYHKKNHSGNVKKKQCDVCGATFAASSSIRNHMMIHLGHKPYQCSQCDMSFVQAGGLRTHEKTHNNTSRSHKCELCGKMMTSKGLAYHLMVHEGSRPYKCDKCSKAFVTDFKLRKHKKIHLRLGHYKSEEEAGILKSRRKSIPCLPKEDEQPTVFPSVSTSLNNIPYTTNN